VLQELHLRGLGVIAEASVELAPGLNVVTGETGVGKTLLVTSLALLTGARGHARLVSEGASEAVVQAVIDPPTSVREGLAARGIESERELLLVRRLSSDGRSRAFIDGQLVPIAMLGEVGEMLVELHGQGAGFALARPAAQLAAIDALGRNDDLLANYREALSVMRALERERTELASSEASRARELDLLAYQLDEIDRAGLSEGEEDRLHASIARFEHAEKLGAIGAEVVALAGSEGAAGDLAEAHKALQSAVAFDADVAPLVSRLGDVAAEASELAHEIRAWGESMESDPSQLEALRERKALIATLKRKYGANVEEVLAYAEQSRAQLDKLTGADERITTIDAELADARTAVDKIASELTKRRKRASKDLTKLVSEELPALALPNAVFRAELEPTEPTESGADRVTFRFSSSSSRSAEEIGKIASGGELSRAMIAVTLALAQAHAVPILVFDEADAGVGGEAALELGRRLQRLGRSHQVLVVSHLPQIAAFADRHIAIERDGDDVSFRVLDDGERLREVSRMLAGLGSSELAQAHASELLDLAAAK
jgi:DNA repair protein RecN (Recombination protein N)